MQKWIIFGIVIIIILAGIYVAFNVDIETDYTPEIEIDENNLRKTILSLYFINKDTNEIEKETRLIDSKELLKDPYKKVINMLISGPENDNLLGVIPENTEVTSMDLDKDVLNIRVSKEILSVFNDNEKKDMIIRTISNTMKEFKEINSVNIVVED